MDRGGAAATIRRMSRLSRFAVVVATAVVSVALAVGPVVATEGGGGGGSGEPTKIQWPDNRRDQVGLVILGIAGGLTVLASVNAVQQLRGRRPQASGEWRWR